MADGNQYEDDQMCRIYVQAILRFALQMILDKKN